MNERDLFLSALEIEDSAARKAHLQSACAGNAELLSRVESLLASHEGASRFLQTPVGEQLGDDPTGETAATLVVGTGSTHDESASGEARSVIEFSPNQERVNMADETPLGYLEPSTKPGSLGRLAHYEILEVVGHGAFGTVLRAFDEKLQRVVAIKVMAPELAATSPARKRFIREAQASAQIRHENVVSVYSVEEKPIPYLVMEYIPGLTLQQRLDERGPLDVPTVLRLGTQIAEGLAAAHAKELIHRDIKPGNILLESGMRDRVKITDFGLARAADDASMTQSGTIAGTPMYMAPEQALGHKLDQRADLFSFGSVLYQMASGRPPFRAASTLAVLKRLTEETPRPIQEIIPETPTWLCDIITKLHARNPNERYQSAREIADVLANCEAQLKEHSRLKDLSLIPRAKAQPAGWWKWVAVAAVALPLLAIGLYAVTRPGSQPKVAGNGTIKPPTPDPIKPASALTPNQVTKQGVPESDGWVQLFNGKDLTGWKPHPLAPGDWCVEDGAIVGRGGISLLLSESGDYANFHLRAEVKINATGDSGICFRLPHQGRPDNLPAQSEITGGYEAQIAVRSNYPVHTGSVMISVDPARAPLVHKAPLMLHRPDQWFVLEVIAEGDRIQTSVNGKPAADYRDDQQRFSRGRLALHTWGANITFVQFRKIEIKELPASSPEVPKRAADFLAFIQGTWQREAVIVEPKLPPNDARSAGQLTFDAVANGKVMRGHSVDEHGRSTSLTLHFYDEASDRLKSWSFSAEDGATASNFGVYDAASRSFLWEEPLPDGVTSLHHMDFVDANTVRSKIYDRDAAGKTVYESRVTFTRTSTPPAVPMSAIDPKRPDEMKVLDRLAGEWRNEITVAIPGTTDPPKKEVLRTKARSILGGRLIETIDTNETTNSSDYSLLWYDVAAKRYRLTAFLGNGQVIDFSGTWDETTQTLALTEPNGVRFGHMIFKSDDLYELRRAARNPAGNIVFDATGVARRVNPLPPTYKNSLGMEFVIVPKGKSWLGGGNDRLGDKEVEIPADFYLGKYEVTQEEWEKVMGENPCHFSRNGEGKDAVKDITDADLKRFPVENVSWDQCQIFVAKLNEREKESGWVYRLPKEAEWEYACRGGPMAVKVDSAFDFYFAKPKKPLLPDQANFEYGKGLKRTCKVGLYEPNSLGLYDMHGNVWEWCDDTEQGANGASHRVNRGGGWNCEPESCRAARRHPFGGVSPPSDRHSVLGLRLARVPAGAPSAESKALPVAVAPFVILARDAAAEQKFASLAQAVAAAKERETIEIRGNGPFPTDPVVLSKTLTLRAGEGYRPVLIHTQAGSLLWAKAPLTLEGLEIHSFGNKHKVKESQVALVQTTQQPLRIAHCRIVVTGELVAIQTYASPLLEVMSSEIFSQDHNSIDLGLADKVKLVVKNCTLAGRGAIALYQNGKPCQDAEIEFTGNTFVAAEWFAWSHRFFHEPMGAGNEAFRSLSIKAVGNVFQCRRSFAGVIHADAENPFRSAALCDWYRAHVAWEGRDNLYAVQGLYLICHEGDKAPEKQWNALKDWNEFWKVEKGSGMEGTPLFAGGDLVERAGQDPMKLAAADFRLKQGSPGAGSGPDGENLGADVGLVGPGDAYEKWKATPGYQDWLKQNPASGL